MMTPRLQAWLGLAAGIIAGFALLAALLDNGARPGTSFDLLALAICLAGAATSLLSRRGRRCKAQSDKR